MSIRITHRWSLLVALVLVLALPALAARGPDLPDYPAEEVAPGLYVIHGPVAYPTPENQGFMNNPAFLVTETGVIVVDPGSSVQTGEMVLRQIRKLTDKPLLAVLNTHVHGDHWLGNQAMIAVAPEVPIYGHPKMLEQIAQGAGEQWVALMLRATDSATEGTVAMGPTRALEGGETLTLGGLTFKTHYYPHVHTTTDLMFELPELGVLFLGDNACNRRIVRMDDGSFPGSIAALDGVRAEVQAEILIPGHGRTGGWQIVDDYRTYLAGVYEGVVELYEEGLSDFDMKPIIAERLAQFHDWPGFAEELGKHISLAYLEVEAAAF
ncbi:MAG: MBL fold metallo-hydrolase [Chromatiaceae bacterium]|jgi:glyoxylase-like metal-dependent hydrolase (beta-lactamase superfamily II)|nr:MBL fold metallo-hydrolase [Chromatiaceae bacterium]